MGSNPYTVLPNPVIVIKRRPCLPLFWKSGSTQSQETAWNLVSVESMQVSPSLYSVYQYPYQPTLHTIAPYQPTLHTIVPYQPTLHTIVRSQLSQEMPTLLDKGEQHMFIISEAEAVIRVFLYAMEAIPAGSFMRTKL